MKTHNEIRSEYSKSRAALKRRLKELKAILHESELKEEADIRALHKLCSHRTEDDECLIIPDGTGFYICDRCGKVFAEKDLLISIELVNKEVI
jgi:hypothetical protein